jgi:hypothetical protein
VDWSIPMSKKAPTLWALAKEIVAPPPAEGLEEYWAQAQALWARAGHYRSFSYRRLQQLVLERVGGVPGPVPAREGM